MNKIARLLFLAPMLWTPTSSLAQSPFDGTWRVNIEQSKLSQKPDVFSVNKGMYDCSSCTPKIHVKAGGQDQAVTTGESFTAKLDGKDYPAKGSYGYNSVSLKRIDDRTMEWTTKRDGKVIVISKVAVGPDGKRMTFFETNKLTGATETVVAEKQ